MKPKDTVFSTPQASIEPFAFNSQVADVFDDMISRSVPLYHEVQKASVTLARRFVQANTSVYDLGCSTGTTLALLAQNNLAEGVKFIGIDNSAPMLQRCREKLDDLGIGEHIELLNEEIERVSCENASLVVLNYTLQFIRPEQRCDILARICKEMRPGGAILLTEKVCHRDPLLQDAFTELYYNFKRENGYSELEISQKREALENVLVPLTMEENASMLRDAGFDEVEPYLKWYTFVSFIARKAAQG